MIRCSACGVLACIGSFNFVGGGGGLFSVSLSLSFSIRGGATQSSCRALL
jgi:hypothetical protein